MKELIVLADHCVIKMDDFFVCIDEPAIKRRVLLQSSRDLLSCLKILEDFLDVKREKKELFAQFHLVLDEISVLNSKLGSKLPKSRVFPEEKEFKMSRLPDTRFKKVKKTRTAQSRLDALEQELASIENKLKTLE